MLIFKVLIYVTENLQFQFVVANVSNVESSRETPICCTVFAEYVTLTSKD